VPSSVAALPSRDGYTLSKWMSEHILRSAAQHPQLSRAFQLHVYRPGTITGHSVTGHCHRTDFLPRYLECALQLGAVVDVAGGYLELVPVDVTSAVITQISCDRESSGTVAAAASSTSTPPPVGCFHVCNQQKNLISYRALGQMMADSKVSAQPLRALPHAQWYDLFTAHKQNALYALDSFVSDERFFRSPLTAHDCSCTLAALRALPPPQQQQQKQQASSPAAATAPQPRLDFPPIDQALIHVYLKRMAQYLK
jgi:thioester reductase-like protein